MPRRTSLPSRLYRLLTLLVLVLVLAACAETPPPKPPLRELPPPASALLDKVPTEYGQVTPIVLPDDQGSAATQATFATLAGPNAVHEPALDLVAAVVGRTYAETQEQPARALLQWLYWKCGAVSLPGPVNVFVAPPDAGPYFQEHLRKLASFVPQAGEAVSFGLARIAVNGYVAQAIAIGRHKVDAAAMAKSQAAGAKVPVRIAVRKPSTDLTLFVDQGGPEVVAIPMTKLEDGSFTAEAPMPTAPGRYFAEVTGVEIPPDGVAQHGWRTTLLWLPFYVGTAEPAAADEFIRHPQKNHPDRSAWAPQILAAYNDARARLGRPPLAPEQAATALAQGRSDQIAALADLPPPDNTMGQKLAAAGLPPRNLFGFVDEIEFVSEYITLRLLRPAARYALFNANVNTIALGLSPRAADRGFYNSAEYVFETIRVDPPKERERVFGLLDAAKGAPFARNEALTKGAQAIADDICKGGPQPADANAVFGRVKGIDASLNNRLVAPWVAYDFDRQDAAEMMKDAAAFTDVGVGACQGTVDGKPGIVVLMILFAGPMPPAAPSGSPPAPNSPKPAP